MLYPASSTKQYPSISKITEWLKSVAISDTPLSSEHVRTLLDMLVYSAEIEALPAMLLGNDGGSESENASSGEESDINRKKKTKKRSKSGSESDDDEAPSTSRNKKRKKRSRDDESNSDSESEDDAPSKKRAKNKKRKAHRDDSGSGSESDSDASDAGSDRGRKRSSSKSRSRSKSASRKIKRDEDDEELEEATVDMDFANIDIFARSAAQGGPAGARDGPRLRQDLTLSHITDADRVVYRALSRNPAVSNTVMSGWSQSPCGHCPRFDFCEDSGPINPIGCQYFDAWFEGEGDPGVDEHADGNDDDDDEDEGGPDLEVAVEQ